MMSLTHKKLRAVLCAYLGQELTPEVAAYIEVYAMGKSDLSRDPASFGERTYKGIVFRCERFSDIGSDLRWLHEEHYAETESYRESISISPDYDELAELERSGELMQFTARDAASSEIAGSIVMRLFRDTTTSALCASDIEVFVLPRFRKGFMAARFFSFVEECLKSVGVREIQIATKTINNAGRLFEYLDYKHAANLYSKVLGD